MLRRVTVLTTLLASFLFAVGCGGGNASSGNNGGGQSTTAQGVYKGTTANNFTFETIVLPNDKVYAIYGTTSGNLFTISGMMTGQGASNNGTYTANLSDFYLTTAPVSATLSASYVAGSSLNGAVTEGGSSLTFTGQAIPTSSFDYNTPAATSTLAGNWTGSSLDGSSSTVSVTSSGTFTGTSGACSFSGTVTPDSSKNFFSFSMSFGGSPCLAPNQTASGVAVAYLLPDGVTHQLVVAGTTSGGNGDVFIATK